MIAYSIRETAGYYLIFATYTHSVKNVKITLFKVESILLSVDKEEVTVPSQITVLVEVRDQLDRPLPEVEVSLLLNEEAFSSVTFAESVTDENGTVAFELQVSDAREYEIKALADGLESNVAHLEAELPLTRTPMFWLIVILATVLVVSFFIRKVLLR